MLTAGGYGNASAYFDDNVNLATAFFLGLSGINGFMQHRPVSVYSVLTMGGVPLSIQARAQSPSAMIVGRIGPRMAAFPLRPEWNFDTALT